MDSDPDRHDLLSTDPDDMIPVEIEAGDGPHTVWHTPSEYARYMRGVDIEAANAMYEPIEDEDE